MPSGVLQRRALRLSSLLLTCAVLCGPALAQTPSDGLSAHWIGTWGTAPFAQKNSLLTGGFTLGETAATLRQIAHVSIGGSTVRVTLSNAFGAEPLTIGAAGIALRESGSAIASSAPLTFHGQPSVIIPPGAVVVSDAAPLTVAPLSDVAVSLFIPAQPLTVLSRHGSASQTNYIVAGDAVTAPSLPASAKTFSSWNFLAGIDVLGDADAAAIVAFGDSITDGAKSTPSTNARWPDILAARLHANPATARLGMLNEGIGGNRVLHDTTGPSALARFDRDVLAQAGVKFLIVMESINDIGHAADPDPAKRYDIVTADDLIGGLEQLARRAHTHGIKVIGATLTPYVGAGYQSPAGETMRKAVNAWIRSTKELDGVIDFDKATADPARPDVFLPPTTAATTSTPTTPATKPWAIPSTSSSSRSPRASSPQV